VPEPVLVEFPEPVSSNNPIVLISSASRNSLAIAPSGAILLGANTIRVVWDLVNAGMLPLLLSFPQKNCGERKTPRVEDDTGPPGEKDCLNRVLIIYWLLSRRLSKKGKAVPLILKDLGYLSSG